MVAHQRDEHQSGRQHARLNRLVVVLAAGAIAVLVQSLIHVDHATPAWRILAGLALFFIGDTALFHIRFGRNQQSFTWSEVAVVIGLIVVPSPWLGEAAAVGVALAHMARRRPAVKVIFNAATATLGVTVARLAFLAVTTGAVSDQMRSPREFVGLALAGLVFWVWNSLAVAVAVATSQSLPLLQVYRKVFLLNLLVATGNIASGILLIALAVVDPIVLFAAPVLAVLLIMAYRGYLRAMRESDRWEVLQAASRDLLRVDQLELARAVLERSRTLFNAEFVELMLVDAEPGTTVTGHRLLEGSAMESFCGSPFDIGGSYWGRVLADREPFELRARHCPQGARDQMAEHGLLSSAIAPLLTESGCIGALRIGFRSNVELGARELQVFGTFANHVSAAVSNAHMFEEMRTMALKDPLTGLPNRALLIDRLAQALARSRRLDTRLSVLFLDLDRFKVVNDSLGHEAGDELLVAVAQRLVAQLRPGDTAVRFGGDEFVVICEDLEGGDAAVAIADRIAESLRSPFIIRGRDTYVTVSVGLVLSATGAEDPVALLRDADAAMYRAKEHGRARCEVFDDALRSVLVTRLERENDLRGSLGQGQLVVHYQPTVSMADQSITGAEALVRWQHPTAGLLAPSEFIPLAEESDLILGLGEEVLRQVAHDSHRLPGLTIAVNLASRQLAQPDLVGKIAAILDESAMAPSSLCLEITESALLSDTVGAVARLEQLRALGVTIALDDFGTGYSSLSHLRDLPVDIVKIDRTFVTHLLTEDKEHAIVRSVIDVAHALGLSVVAEGVETAGQLGALQAMGCDTAQGYYFAAAKPIGDLVELRDSARLFQG